MVGVAGLTLVLLVVLAAVVTQRAQENAAERVLRSVTSAIAQEIVDLQTSGTPLRDLADGAELARAIEQAQHRVRILTPYFLPEDRVYDTYQDMFEKESELPEGERMDFVSIVTPNFVHFDPAMMALDHGFHVVLDKPITFTLEQALQLKEKLDKTGLTFALTHTYSGYPAVKHAKKFVHDVQYYAEDAGRADHLCLGGPR